MQQNPPKKILITGGTGLLGSILTKNLQSAGHQVAVLSRNPGRIKNVPAFFWDIEKGQIDESCLTDIQIIIHLAGENIAEKKWTKQRKKELIESRTKSISIIYKLLEKNPSNSVEKVISASAVGYYGDRGDEVLTENSVPGNGFLSECCVQWESAVEQGKTLGFDIVIFRIGLLLTNQGGILAPLKRMAQWFSAMSMGTGKQWFPWIHEADLSGMFLRAVNIREVTGVYNACAPRPVTNSVFMNTLANVLKRPFWPISVPKYLIKLLLGERQVLLTMSTRTSAEKAIQNGFTYTFSELKDALADVTQTPRANLVRSFPFSQNG